MDNYVILEAMSPGTFGTTLLVSDTKTDTEFTLKKIECLDEGSANEALQEALPLLGISHPSIVRYREMFICWDKEISSVILNVVMDCPYTDTLHTIITNHRIEKQTFNQKVVLTLLGQMIDALAYIHKQDIIHRNIKPSNIQVVSQTFRLCDFGTAALSRDRMKIKVKAKQDQQCWMAPECLSQQVWSDKSDIWSLGCVLLDMLTCHINSETAAMYQLINLKKKKSALDVIVAQNVQSVLREMFRNEPHYRANVWDLMKDPLVQRCLELCGSPVHVMTSLPSGVSGPPFHEGLHKVLGFMQTYKDVESVQLQCLSYVLSEKEQVIGCQDDVVKITMSTMRAHKDSGGVQLKACQVLHLCVEAGEESGVQKQCVFEGEAISCILAAIETHISNPELLSQAFLLLLLLLSENMRSVQCFLQLNGISAVFKALKAFPQHCAIASHACRCLWMSLRQTELPGEVSLLGCVEAVCEVADVHRQDATVMEDVCSALLALSSHGTMEGKDVEDVTLTLLRALQDHTGQHTLVQRAFATLGNLTHMSNVACLRLLVGPGGRSGIMVMREARQQYPGDQQLTLSMVKVLADMAKHDKLVEELVAVNTQDDLRQSEADCASDENMKRLVQTTLSRLKKVEKKKKKSSS
ncbi:serine/threonine kinase-like domain-containing protein STKLD1 [Engraulis encrasicolus]|uniref:serine/threonine kinase-like domain-containing protein STKLD1 n=1 Tax=Engraulis encrasicolus TaxID=184585 RepID=UPI002FD00842